MLTGEVAIQVAVPRKRAQPIQSITMRSLGDVELGAHAREEEGGGEEDDAEHIVRGALDVPARLRGLHLRFRVEPVGLGAGRNLVLGHRERGQRRLRDS